MKTKAELIAAKAEIDALKIRVLVLAMLAADGPCFSNPLSAMAAKELRDKVLVDAGYLPNGERSKTL